MVQLRSTQLVPCAEATRNRAAAGQSTHQRPPLAPSRGLLQAERLADARQQVRQDACEVLLKLLHALKPEAVIPRLARFWTHRSWKVRHGVLQTLAEAVASGIPMLLNHKDQNNYIITQVVNLVEDPNE